MWPEASKSRVPGYLFNKINANFDPVPLTLDSLDIYYDL